MAKFTYKGRSATGGLTEGQVEAGDKNAAASVLFSRGITPLDITEASENKDVMEDINRYLAKKPTLDDILLFARQMYALTKSGIPITRAIAGLSESMTNIFMVEAMQDVFEQLESGRPLSAALSRHPKIFSSLFISMVNVGENTGRLDEAFQQLAFFIEREKNTRNNIKQALRYPSFVIGAITVAIVIINIFVIPGFAKLFLSFNLELPWATKLLLATSKFFVDYWHVMLIALVGSVVGFKHYINTEEGKYKWHRFILKIPLIGSILLRSFLSRFARSFAMTYRSGVPILQSLNVVSRAVDNEYISQKVIGMREAIERGEGITRTAISMNVFTPVVLQMLAVGEEAGTIDEMMDHVADFYDQEVDYDVKALSDNIEPFIYVALGVLVLILAFGVLLPMWDMVQVATR
ncbi:MAG: type II secretion system F family protein [Gammaproteobacteria bacterium]|nr:type II secretion system F family protein [Gammaproteobacteria bacterium]